MKSETMPIIGRFSIALGIMLAMAAVILGVAISPTAFANDGNLVAAEAPPPGNEPARTIMIYLDGASSEENTPVCSAMLKEYMASKFDRSDFRIIVMTGGSLKWHLDAGYLRDKDGNAGTLTEISSEYNQVWEVYGAKDGAEGYLRLLDGDGVSGDGAEAKKSEDELMSDPNTLRQFINYAHNIAPAGKYDLILNDHGSGPQRGYGYDNHNTENPDDALSVLELRQAISGSDVCAQGGKFDFINLDCCVMGNFETALALSDYTGYFLGSADVDPHPTVDYTAVFDFLATDPDMDAWILGRELVDLFVDYYNEHPEEVSVGPSDIYCAVDMNKLKQSGIVDKLLAIAKQMRAEATAGSFYDEIRVPKDAYSFAYASLQDFATVMEQLGIGVYESDWQDPGFLNAYTQSALEVQNILHDEDIVYSKHTRRSDEMHVFFGRDDGGSITARVTKSPTSGLSIFAYANPNDGDVSGEVASYIVAMRELSGEYAEGSAERELLETYVQAVLDYELICHAGIAVSTLVEGGCAPDEIDYNKVLDYLKSQESEHTKSGWEYISKAFEASDRDVEAWLGGIIDIQRKEVLNDDKASLKTESKDGTDCYRIDVTDTPKRVVDVPVLIVTAGTAVEPFKNPTMVFYGSADSSATGDSSEDYMTKTDSSYLIPKFDGQWYAVEDSEGVKHIASAASDHSVFASFLLNGKSLGTGELIFDADGNAKSIYVYGNTIPIALDSLEGMVMVTLENDPFGEAAGPIDMPFVLEKTNAKLVRDHYSNLGIGSVETKLAISDMYGVQHEVKPELEFDPAGGQWPDGTGAVKKFEAALETSFDIIDAPTRDGYTFVCWKGSEYQPGDKFLADSDHAFEAQWKKDGSGGNTPLALAGVGHVQNYGNKKATEKTDGIVIGTTGQSKQLEQFSVSLPEGTDGSIEYRGHLQGIGWSGWVADGAPCGTTGESRRIEAVQMKLSGNVADDYSVWYRVHSKAFGWLGWARDGEAAGTAGQSRRAEAIEVQALPKGQVPGGYVKGRASYIGAATADMHLQGIGWTGSGSALEFGTTGQSRRLEAIRLSIPNQPAAGGVVYEVHAQGIGWMGKVANGALAGTTGQSRRLEAVRISLTGNMASGFSVWYRVHSQSYGWLGWAHDGQNAGTTGLSKRAEAIDVQILPAGQVPHGYNASKPACVTR